MFVCQLSEEKRTILINRVIASLEGYTEEYIKEVVNNVLSERLYNLEYYLLKDII